MPTATDLLGFAIDKNPIDFADAVNQILQQKASDLVDAHRETLAQSIYGNPPEEEDFFGDEDGTEGFEDDDTDFEDIDLDAIDLEDYTDDENDA